MTSAIMMLHHDIIYHSTFICPYESRKCGKEGTSTEMWISREWKEYSDEINSIVHSFWRAFIWPKKEKNSEHKL